MHSSSNSPDTPTSIDLLDWLAQDFSQVKTANPTWQIHKCQITQSLISQHEPMKLIYHYERLDEGEKANFPLTGVLLKQFDRLMTREDFAKLLNIDIKHVAKPWQLKFMGKLVIFTDNPEVAIRLHWTNTLKSFEPVDTSELTTAVEQAFSHWQFVDSVEVISKNLTVSLIASYKEHPLSENLSTWQPINHQQFEPLPAPLGLQIQQLFNNAETVQQHWLPRLQELALDKAEQWQVR